FALGAILYCALAGRPLYHAGSLPVLPDAMREGPRPLGERNPGMPPELRAIVERAMAYDPAARYASAKQLAADLSRFQAGQLVAAHRYSARDLVRRWLRRYAATLAV